MIRFTGDELAQSFNEAFDRPIDTLTQRQLWWLVKFSKHVRGRCRSNAAFNNYMSTNFRHAAFVEVSKVDDRTGESYKGLEIHMKG
jgi:hypothetical protein